MGRPGLDRHPKFRRLVLMLGESRAIVRGSLELLWDTAYECGNPSIGESVDVELACDWRGEPGKLCRALLECGGNRHAGFIEPIDGEPERYQIHDLFDHCPEYVSGRHERENERQQAKTCERCGETYHSTKRWSKYCCNACRQGAHRQDETGKHGVLRERVTHGNASLRNATNCYSTPAPAPAPTLSSYSEPASPDSKPDQSVVLIFPTVGTGQKEWALTSSHMAGFKEAFPGVDVLAECRKARLWCESNPAKRKTARGMPRFLQGWLERAQNAGKGDGKVSANGKPHQCQPPTDADLEELNRVGLANYGEDHHG